MNKKLTEIIPYKKTVWITGFLKTTLSSALISTGVVLILNGIAEHPLLSSKWTELDILVGFIAIIFAIFIIILIDSWKERKKKEELESIQTLIDNKAEDIATKKVISKLKELE